MEFELFSVVGNSSVYDAPHVLGVVSTMQIAPTTVVIIIAAISMIIIGVGLDYLMVWAKLYQYEAIIYSLVRQTCILGTLSLLLFLFACLGRGNDALYDATLSIKFMDIILLFLLLGFLAQTFQLISV